MKKKIILTIATIVVISILTVLAVIVFWQPYELKNCESITLSYNQKSITLSVDDDNYKQVNNLVKQALNSSKFSLFFLNEKIHIPCSDWAIESMKSNETLWVEINIDDSEYKKIFFTINPNTDTQMLHLFASTSATNYSGEIFHFNKCDCKQLLEYMQNL